jgi:hypothetical protein
MAAQVEAGWEKLLGSGKKVYDFANVDHDMFAELTEPEDSMDEPNIESQESSSDANEEPDESSLLNEIEPLDANLRLKGDLELLEGNNPEKDLKGKHNFLQMKLEDLTIN